MKHWLPSPRYTDWPGQCGEAAAPTLMSVPVRFSPAGEPAFPAKKTLPFPGRLNQYLHGAVAKAASKRERNRLNLDDSIGTDSHEPTRSREIVIETGDPPSQFDNATSALSWPTYYSDTFSFCAGRLPTPFTPMIPRKMSALVVLALLAVSPQVVAQTAPASGTSSPPQGGLSLTPFVSLSTTYDDNLFVTPTNRQDDTILSVAPGVSLKYRSRRTDFAMLYSLSADKYFNHPELNSLVDEQLGFISLHHQVTRRFTLGITGSYLETHNPGQLSPESGLVVGRNRATNTTLRPALAYDLSPTSAIKLFYERSWQNITTGDRVDTGTASATFNHQLSERDSIEFRLQNISYDFNTGGSPNSTVVTAGWTHDFSPSTSITLSGGPRDTEGNIRPEVLASIGYHSLDTTLLFTYQKTQTVVIGETGLLNTQSLSTTFAFTPIRQFSFGFSPSYYYNSGAGLNTRGWNLGFFAWYRFAPAWSLGLTYGYEHQRETSGVGPPGTIQRNLVSLTLRWQLPGRGEGLPILPPPTAGPGPGPTGG